MQLISINIGREQTQQRKDRIEITGIYKIPVNESVEIKSLGIESDFIYDKKNHGGLDQALYIYGGADYAWWSKELEREISPGTFGDNLTISDLECADFNIGDYLHIGAVSLQITAPRIPCNTFATRMNDPEWVKKFRHAGRPGLYCRVIKEGTIHAGDSVLVEKYSGKTVSIAESYRDYYDRNKTKETIRRHLKAPLATRLRKILEDELQKLIVSN